MKTHWCYNQITKVVVVGVFSELHQELELSQYLQHVIVTRDSEKVDQVAGALLEEHVLTMNICDAFFQSQAPFTAFLTAYLWDKTRSFWDRLLHFPMSERASVWPV